MSQRNPTRRKKRGAGPSQAEKRKSPSEDSQTGNQAPSEQRPIPAARPPRKNRALLIVSAALVALWMIVLIVLAIGSAGEKASRPDAETGWHINMKSAVQTA